MTKKKTKQEPSLFGGVAHQPEVQPSQPDMANPVILDQPGRFQLVHKGLLNIDHEYQRTNVQESIVKKIATRFSWVKFGVLLAAERPDKMLFLFDGQHRKLGSDRIDAIETVPCMIYQSTGRSSEAKYFLEIQTDRTKVTSLDKFRAQLTANDPVAVFCQNMIAASGYAVAPNGAVRTVGIISSIYRCMTKNPDATRAAWETCVRLFDGKPILEKPFLGFYTLERHVNRSEFKSILAEPISNWIGNLTVGGIKKSIDESIATRGGPGADVYADGIIKLLNLRRRSKKVPPIFPEMSGGKYDDAV